MGFTDKNLYSIMAGLKAYALKLTYYMEQDAEDLMQETVIKILLNRDKYKDDYAPSTWAFSVMKHLHTDRHRHTSITSKRVQSVDDYNQEYENGDKRMVIDFGTSKDATVFDELREKDIKKAADFFMDKLEEMSPLYVNIMVLRSRGVMLKDIAEELGLPMGSLKARIFRIQEHMNNTYYKIYADIVKDL